MNDTTATAIEKKSDRANLLDALDYLTIEHIITTTKDNGSKHFEPHQALIKQLRDAIASSLGGTGGGKQARERIPLDADALTKYQQLEHAILQRFAAMDIGVPHLLPEDNLRAWYVAFMQTATEQGITNEYKILAQWKTIIEEKLTPPTPIDLPGEECPECGFAWYDTVLNKARPDTRRSDDAAWNWIDSERKPTLTVSYRPDMAGGLTKSFAKCGNCNHVWMGVTGIRVLAELISTHDTPQQMTAN